jgi:hypothetical protein
MPTGGFSDVFSQKDLATKCKGDGSSRCMRPVNAVFRKGEMFVSSDTTGEVIRIRKGSTGGSESGGSGSPRSSLALTSSMSNLLYLSIGVLWAFISYNIL